MLSGNTKISRLLATCACLVGVQARADVSPEQYSSYCAPGTDDTLCWQRAIHESAANGTLAASSQRTYQIRRTLVVCNGIDGTIDGHGAILVWAGPADEPMFLIVNSYHMVLANFSVQVRAPHRLQTAFEFASAQSSPVGLDCPGPRRPSSKNSVEHVDVGGTALNDLMYGVRLSNRYGYDANNDMTRIVNSNFTNVTAAVVSVETTQSHQNEVVDVTGYGAPGNRGCFVSANTGYISSTGGFQGTWGKAAFCVNGGFGPFSIVNPDSEGSARLVSVGNTGDIAGYPVSVSVSGGRFAADAVDKDGYVISFNRLGSLSVHGLRIDGDRPKGVTPAISVQPGRPANSRAGASLVVEGVVFFIKGSREWSPIVAPDWVTVSDSGNICLDDDGTPTPCRRWRRPGMKGRADE
jgi:hypothetical protein